ncbi:carbohydrate kinase family protein [Zongyangia hominis]|uniref:Carbohydrate kinase family protein n=1 Tax=Zongyangia hominis TaxID=2763677 RepID=A0A926IC96_9FIRM|nr:carbohydrate kinase family protein [Zongyangia hominis]MBC8570885.1 carbohydrate kinase family protein [Zongyangia hominis]
MKKIACIGMVAVDIITSPAPALPPIGQCKRVETTKMYVGGNAANSALDLAKLGVPVRLSCRIGGDSLGRFVHSEFDRYGVNTQSVTIDENAETSTSIVCLDPVEKNRRCLLSTQSNDFFTTEDISDELIAASDIIFLTGVCQLKAFDGDQLAQFAKRVHDLGKFVAMDVLWDLDDVWLPKIQESLPYVDLFMPSFDEVEKMIHKTDPYEMIKMLRTLGPQNVIIKLGRHGIIVMEGDEEPYRMPAWDVPNIIDTTGAGDAFCAGTLTGLAKGMKLSDATSLGQAVSAFCIQDYGTYAGVQSLEQVFYAMNSGDMRPYSAYMD